MNHNEVLGTISEWADISKLPIMTGSEDPCPSKLVVVTITVIFVMGLQSEVDTRKRSLHSPF